MFNLILKRIKSNFIHYFLIFIGYLSALLVISFGFAFLKCSKDMTIDYTNGKIADQKLITVNFNEMNNKNYDNLISILKECSKTTSIRIDGLFEEIEKSEGYFQVPIELVIFNETPEWIPKLDKGRYFKSNESKSNSKIAVIGKGLELNNISSNNSINLCNETFKIIGTVGKTSDFSNYLGAMFIPLESLPDKIKENISTLNIYLLKNNSSPTEEMNYILNKLNNLHNVEATETKLNVNSSEFYSNLAINTFVSLLIVLVSISNISILMFYLMLKNKKNILISIALGSTKSIVQKQIFIELMIISIFSIISAFIIGNLSIPFVKNVFTNILNIEEIQLNYLNIIITSLISILMNYLISLISVRKFFNLNLSMELRGE